MASSDLVGKRGIGPGRPGEARVIAFPGPRIADRAGSPGASARGSEHPARRLAVVVTAFVLIVGLLLLGGPVRRYVDFPLEGALNALARRSGWLDHALSVVDRFNIFQGVALMAVACGLLLEARSNLRKAQLVLTCLGASLAAALSQWAPNAWRHWTAFPSGHAALLFGLACAIFIANARIGLIALGWAVLLGLSRMYEGYHHFSAILGGWLLGAGVVFAGSLVPLRPLGALYQQAANHRFWAGLLLFTCAAAAAGLFDDASRLASALPKPLLHG